MIYQKMYMGDPPYLINNRGNARFAIHNHREVELFYCLRGSYDIIINHDAYTIHEGDLAIIGTMVPHELPETNEDYKDSYSLVIGIGPAFLGASFNYFENALFENPIFHLKNDNYAPLRDLLEQSNRLKGTSGTFSHLEINGNIYKVCSFILENMVCNSISLNKSKKLNKIMNVENAIEYMYRHYNEDLSVDIVADVCGYSKSNFCKIFKATTGNTFHNILNKYRIKMACIMLRDSELSVDNIAERTGFSSSKSFCRVFRAEKGVSPGTYRKKD